MCGMTALCSPKALHRPVRLRFWLVWLLAALLWAPVWGQWHGLAHQVRQSAVQDGAVVPVSVAVATPEGASQQGDADTQGSAPCQLLDHLLLAGGLATALLRVPQTTCPSDCVQWLALNRVPQSLGWLAQARAPPHRI